MEVTAAFATQVETAFAVYRFALYDAFGLHRPTTAEQEHQQGQQLTAHLWYGDPLPVPPATDQTSG